MRYKTNTEIQRLALVKKIATGIEAYFTSLGYPVNVNGYTFLSYVDGAVGFVMIGTYHGVLIQVNNDYLFHSLFVMPLKVTDTHQQMRESGISIEWIHENKLHFENPRYNCVGDFIWRHLSSGKYMHAFSADEMLLRSMKPVFLRSGNGPIFTGCEIRKFITALDRHRIIPSWKTLETLNKIVARALKTGK